MLENPQFFHVYILNYFFDYPRQMPCPSAAHIASVANETWIDIMNELHVQA